MRKLPQSGSCCEQAQRGNACRCQCWAWRRKLRACTGQKCLIQSVSLFARGVMPQLMRAQQLKQAEQVRASQLNLDAREGPSKRRTPGQHL